MLNDRIGAGETYEGSGDNYRPERDKIPKIKDGIR